MLKIIKPSVGLHDGSSFREVIDTWDELGLCNVVPGDVPKKPWNLEETQLIESRPWVNEIGDIMLYDNPVLDKLHDKLSWKMALWANDVHKGQNSYAWTFWPKHPKIHAKVVNKGIKSYNDRKNESVFIGSYTTEKRSFFRPNDPHWHTSIQNFWMGNQNQRLYGPEQYLEILGDHKFGLCLPGVGPKCLRDMELIGLGTVPIFVPGVSTDYYEPLEEDKHFLFARNHHEVKRKIQECTKEKWEYMSNECRDWYNRNASAKGSFELTKKIIEKHYEK